MRMETNFNSTKKRDISIDILRFIGISLIILAHVNPPDTILNIRCFDVSLMLFVSGLTMSKRNPDFSLKFLGHRAVRLLLPVWSFLTIYFLLIFALQSFGLDLGITISQCIDTYLLLEGIGFVWIIRVMLLIALLTPSLLWIKNKLSPLALLSLSLIILYSLDILISKSILTDNIIFKDFIYYAIGYSIPFIWGLVLPNLNVRQLIALLTVTGIIILAHYALFIFDSENLSNITSFINTNDILSFNNFKYPPQGYYLLYGLFCSTLLYLVIVKCELYKYLTIFTFIGCNTIWLYLYHIPAIHITGILEFNWLIRFITVYLIAFTLCYIQIKAITYIQIKYHNSWTKSLNFMRG